MGSIDIFRIFHRLTLGTKKDFAGLNNLELFGSSYKVTKSEILSIFSDENDKKIAEEYFNFFNTQKSQNGKEEFLDVEEIEEMAAKLSVDADNDYDIDNVTQEEAESYTKIKGADILFKMIKSITATKDYSKNISSGAFVFNGEVKEFDVTPIDDATGRTYKLTNAGEEYTATFGGTDYRLNMAASTFYSTMFKNSDYSVDYIQTSDGMFGTTHAAAKFREKDKIKKLGLDILLANLENLPTYSGCFGFDSHNQNKGFSPIPTELAEIISSNKYSTNDILNALKVASKISDEDIFSNLAPFDLDEQYAQILVKRRDFLKSMLSMANKNIVDSKLNPQEYFEKLKNLCLKEEITKTNDIKDIQYLQKAIDLIANPETKLELQRLINDKHNELSPQIIPKSLPEITKEELIPILEKFNVYITYADKDFVDYFGDGAKEDTDRGIILPSKEQKQAIIEKYGNISSKIINNLSKEISLDNFVRYVNHWRANGIDILKDEETFISHMIIANTLNRVPSSEAQIYSESAYKIMFDALNTPPTAQELVGLKEYKSDRYWAINNQITVQKREDKEPMPEFANDINMLTSYFNRTLTSTDTIVYRGEGFEIFKSITTADGKNFGIELDRLNTEIHKYLDEDKEVPEELKLEVNNFIDKTQDQNYSTTQERFLSTSASPEVASLFGSLSLIINLPAGSKAACIDMLYIDDALKEEAEILCQRGTELDINDISYDYEMGRWVINVNAITK